MERSTDDKLTTSNKEEDKGDVQSENTKGLALSTKTAVHMSMQEEDLIQRMYMLVGERWDLIAGRIPGRKPAEIQCFWMTKLDDQCSTKSEHAK